MTAGASNLATMSAVIALGCATALALRGPPLQIGGHRSAEDHARRVAPGRSCNNSNLDVCPGFFPVAVGFGAGLAFISLARIARTFLLLLAPAFFFRFFWFGIVTLFLLISA